MASLNEVSPKIGINKITINPVIEKEMASVTHKIIIKINKPNAFLPSIDNSEPFKKGNHITKNIQMNANKKYNKFFFIFIQIPLFYISFLLVF